MAPIIFFLALGSLVIGAFGKATGRGFLKSAVLSFTVLLITLFILGRSSSMVAAHSPILPLGMLAISATIAVLAVMIILRKKEVADRDNSSKTDHGSQGGTARPSPKVRPINQQFIIDRGVSGGDDVIRARPDEPH